MPLYEYELCEGNCKVCGGKFTLRRPLSAKPLDTLSGVQKAGAQNHFILQFAAQAQAALHLRRQEGRVHRAQKSQQGRIREAVNWLRVEGLNHCRAVLQAEWPFNSKRFVDFEFIFDAGCQME